MRLRKLRDHPDEARAIARAREILSHVIDPVISDDGAYDDEESTIDIAQLWYLIDDQRNTRFVAEKAALIEHRVRLLLLTTWTLGGVCFIVTMFRDLLQS